jgi:hypothetical protein
MTWRLYHGCESGQTGGLISINSHMQAVGMVNDHLVTCTRHRPVAKLGAGLRAL